MPDPRRPTSSRFGTGTTLSPGVAGVGTLTVGSAVNHATAESTAAASSRVDLGCAIARPASGIADVNTNDRLTVNGIVDFNTASGNLNVAVNGSGQSFTPGLTYDFALASASDGLSGFNPGRFTITRTNFACPGTYAIESINSTAYLTYSPVPEPSDVILRLSDGHDGMAWWVRFWRRRWQQRICRRRNSRSISSTGCRATKRSRMATQSSPSGSRATTMRSTPAASNS